MLGKGRVEGLLGAERGVKLGLRHAWGSDNLGCQEPKGGSG